MLIALALATASCRAAVAGDPPTPNGPLPLPGPYLVDLDGRAVAVVAGAGGGAPPVVEWWSASNDAEPSGPTTRRVSARRIDGRWVAVLDDLPAGPRIVWRLHSPRGGAGPFAFRAGARPGAPVRFAVYGGTRGGPDVHRRVVEDVAGARVDFVLHTGDMVDDGGDAGQWARFFALERPLLVGAPILPVRGDHDGAPGRGFARVFPRVASPAERRRAADCAFYHRDWGRLRVVVFDTSRACRRDAGQRAAVEAMLAEGARRDLLMVMAMHHPPYSSGAHGSDLDVRAAVAPLAEAHGVELVIAGHDPDYERTRPIRGVTYVVTGSAGAPPLAVDPEPFSAVARSEPHFVLVDVDPGGLALRAVNLRGHVFDYVLVGPRPARGPVKKSSACYGTRSTAISGRVLGVSSSTYARYACGEAPAGHPELAAPRVPRDGGRLLHRLRGAP